MKCGPEFVAAQSYQKVTLLTSTEKTLQRNNNFVRPTDSLQLSYVYLPIYLSIYLDLDRQVDLL